MALIPLRNRQRDVIAHALLETMTTWRWCRLTGRGAPTRATRRIPSVTETRDRRRYFRTVFLHRLLLGLEPGDGLETDHINRDRLDNRRCNLRVVTELEHRSVHSGHASSGYRGVSRQPNGRWVACATTKGKTYRAGVFDTAEQAAEAAAELRRELGIA